MTMSPTPSTAAVGRPPETLTPAQARRLTDAMAMDAAATRLHATKRAELRRVIKDLMANDVAVAAIARQTGLSRQSIYNIANSDD